MMFRSPLPMNDTLRSGVVQTVLPASLRARLGQDLAGPILRRSKFLAAESQADTLQTVNDAILDVLRGDQTEEGARSLLQRLPEILDVPELAKEYRMRMILETNVDLARGFGGWLQTQDSEVLAEYPAWEFYRAEFRKEPRDWPARWEAAGGDFYPGPSDYPEGRMIALKNDPIWVEISAFGLPYAPFDYNSGMDLQDIDRQEAERIGLIQQSLPTPERLSFNDGVIASPDASGVILSALGGYLTQAGIGQLTEGVIKLLSA